MYELEGHTAEVADQIDALPRRAWNDYEAAVIFVLRHPFDGQLIDDRPPGETPRFRFFGLGRGQIVYDVNRYTNRIELSAVTYLGLAGRRLL